MTVFTNAALLGPDGLHWRDIVVRDGVIEAITPCGAARTGDEQDLGGQIVSPGMVDVQVNGGGGVMLGDCRSVADLDRMVRAHLSDGVPQIMPTLISDTRAQIERVAALVAQARAEGLWHIAGLHLEGPHLARAGAHDTAMLRPLEAEDLALYAAMVAGVGCLKITLAPEVVGPEAIAALVRAGVVVSLGHTNCDAATARAAFAAGASTATHLFNAMSGLDHRTPGLALAALEHGRFGLIADGVHVDAGMLRLAARFARGAYLVSDAMAVAGTAADGFEMGGRPIARRDGRLTTAEGTLAGADLTMARAVEVMAQTSALPRAEVIAMATVHPRALIGLPGALEPGQPALFHLWPTDAPPRLHLPQGWDDPAPTPVTRSGT